MKKIFKIYIQQIKNKLWHYPKSLWYRYYYGNPAKNLTLIGITGTDGKTTTVSLIHQVLAESGLKVGLISTLGAKYDTKTIETGLHTTSPDPSQVQPLFKEMVKNGITHVVIEVTAHALDQYRFQGCRFSIAGITNTSHEHLDDFSNYQSYVITKAKLLENANTAILNSDDPSYKLISPLLNNKKTITYGSSKTDNYYLSNIEISPNQLTFKINKHLLSTDSSYRYQAYNISLAYAIIDQLQIDTDTLIKVIKHFPEVKGRREIFSNSFNINCIIDFAHTPAALKSTLESLRQTKNGKLIVIFGATGGRDPSKRPLMGAVVSQLADIAIITADDTRQEKIDNINQQIISGINQSATKKGFKFYDIHNRQEAFNLAVELAKKGDTIIACGKGHEQTILHGQTEYPWSESEAYRTAFKRKYGQI